MLEIEVACTIPAYPKIQRAKKVDPPPDEDETFLLIIIHLQALCYILPFHQIKS